MVSIVTGKINSGKTTQMLARYLNNPIGDGFISLKTMKDGRVMKYDLLQLSNNHETPFVVHELDLLNQEVATQLGPYCFLKEGLDDVEKRIEQMIQKSVEPIYLDEIGVLELKGQGFSNILKKLVASKLDLVLSIRQDLIEEVKRQFKMEETEILSDI